MPHTICIAVVQHRYVGTLKQNTRDCLAAVDQAKALGADLVLFPECVLTGYRLPVTNEDALPDDSVYIRRIADKAKSEKIGIVITAFTRGTARPRNSAFVIDKSGHIVLKYDKVHTCDFSDEACLESGEEFKVCECDGVRIGIMICYDREYPESARVLMLKGAELILVPNDCCLMEPRVQALSTRAYENMVGVVMANPPGNNAGRSCAYSPICWENDEIAVDNTVFLADSHTDGIFLARYDMDRLRDYRSREMMGNTYRKVKAYAPLLAAEIDAPFIRTNQSR